MKNIRCAAILAFAAYANYAQAYESENAIPLTVGAHLSSASVESIRIRLTGREVEIESHIKNPSKAPLAVGFFAITPLFENLGDGEEHADKRFADLTATNNGQTIKTVASYRAYFLGQDITPALRKHGIDAVPSNDVSPQRLSKLTRVRGLPIDQWQGQATHDWVSVIAPQSTGVEVVRYRTLPQFGMEEAGSSQLSQLILQHCGSRELAESLAPQGEQLLFERFELPVQFLKMRALSIKVEQPAPNWLGATPIISLACGIGQQRSSLLEGTIEQANQSVSILVVSRLQHSPTK